MAGNIGLGFAIPSNLAGDVMRQLAATGEVRRGTLGMDTQDVDARHGARRWAWTDARGAVVTRVYPGSAAAAAGLQPGDVIVAANGERIDDREALHNFEGLQAVGARVALDVLRDGKPLQLDAPPARAAARRSTARALDPRLAGATFAELPERLRQAGADGVLVEKVARGSRAAASGLQRRRRGRRRQQRPFRRPARLPPQLRSTTRHNWCCVSCAATCRATC